MGIHITARDALRALANAMEERGADYVYQVEEGSYGACRNWHVKTDEPGCIVGLSVHRLGVSSEIMRACSAGGVDTLRDDLGRHGVTMTDAAAKTFKIAQVVQDNRGPWGAAEAAARQTIHMFGYSDE